MFGGKRKSMPSREEVDGMEYTLATLKESLRKYSVVPVVTRNLVQVRSAGRHVVLIFWVGSGISCPSLPAGRLTCP